jgi:hypothetical protein
MRNFKHNSLAIEKVRERGWLPESDASNARTTSFRSSFFVLLVGDTFALCFSCIRSKLVATARMAKRESLEMSVGCTFPVVVKLFAIDKNSTISLRCTALSQSGLKAFNCKIDDRAALCSSCVITYEEIQTRISSQSFYGKLLLVRVSQYTAAEMSQCRQGS